MAGLGSGPLLLMAMTLLLTVAPLTAAPYLKTGGGDAQKQLPLDEIFRPSQGLIGPLFRQNDHSLDPPTQGGCFYQFRHYEEGDRIITNEPCLNCTCHNSMLMCYLKVCPFSKPIGQDCTVEKSPDQCCPVITCPQVNLQVMQMMSTSTTSSPTTEIMPYTEHGCTIDGEFYPDGVQVPGNPNEPCELCYCIRNHTACLMQECILKVEGCKPIFEDGVCCPIRYKCVHDKYPPQITTTTLAPNGSMITTTLVPPTSKGCVYQNEYYADGASIPSINPCEHCYCMNDDIVCAIQECRSPLDEENEHCTPQPPPPGACCPEAYDCPEVPETTTLEDVGYTTLSPEVATSPEKVGTTGEPSSEKELDEGITTTEAEVDKEIDETSFMMNVTQPTKEDVTDITEVTPATKPVTEKMDEVPTTEKVEEATAEFPFTVMKEIEEAVEKETVSTDPMLIPPETVPESADSKTTVPAVDATTETSISDEDDIMKETSPKESFVTEESVMMDDVPSDDQTDYQFEVDVDEKPKPEDFVTTVKPMIDDLTVTTDDERITDKLPEVVTAEIVTTKPEKTTVSSVLATDITTQAEDTTDETVSEVTKRPDISLETRITHPESETATATESMVDEAVSEATTLRPVEGEETIPEDIPSKRPEEMVDSEITTQTTGVSTDEIGEDYTTTVDSLIRPKPEVDTIPESPETATDKPDDSETFEAEDEEGIDELTSIQPPKTTTKIPSIPTDDDKVTSVSETTSEKDEKEEPTTQPIEDITSDPELASTPLSPQVTTESDIALTDAPTEQTSQDGLSEIDNTTESLIKEECIHDGIHYNHGDFIPKSDPCNICRCMNGMQNCEILKCPPPEEFSNCEKELKPNQCCPTYTCIDIETGNMIVIPDEMLPGHQLVIDEETATEKEVEMPTESSVPVEEKESIEPEMDTSTFIPPTEQSIESMTTETSITTLDSDIAESEVETTTSIDSISTDIDDMEEVELTTTTDQLISTEMPTKEISTDTSIVTEKSPEVISTTISDESVTDDVSTPIPFTTDLVTEQEIDIVDTTASQDIESTTITDEQMTTSIYEPVTSVFEEETEPEESSTVSPDAIDEITDMIEKVTEEHTDTPEQVTEEFTDTPEQVTEEPTDVPEQVTEEVTDIPDQVTEEFTDVPEQVTEESTDVPEQVTEEFSDVPEQVTEEFTDVPEQVTEEPTEVPEQVTEEFTDVPEQVTEEFTDVPEQVTEEPTEVPEQVTEEFTDVPEQVTEEFTDVPGQVTEEPTEVPEQVTEEFTDVPEQVTEVHTDTPEQVTETHTDVPEEVTEGLTDVMEQVTEEHPDIPKEEITTSKPDEATHLSTTPDVFATDEVTTQKEETTEEIISPETESPAVSATIVPDIESETEATTQTADIPDETTQSVEVSDKTTLPTKPLEEITTQVPGVSEETTKEATSETSAISTQIPEAISSPSSEPSEEKEDTTYEPVTSHSVDEFTATTPEDSLIPTEVPGIPGEGNCNVNGTVYPDEAIVPVTNKCQVQCRCKDSQVKCTLAACPPAPPTFLRCNSDQKSDECCPTFECADISPTETPSPNCVRDGNQYMEGEYVPSTDLCTDCFCIGGEIVCAVLECQIPHHLCVPIRSSSIQEMCCPDMFECPEPVLSLPMDDGDIAETDSSIFPLSSQPITPAGPYTNETDESATQNVTFPDSQTESFNDTFTMKPITLIPDATPSEISLSETTETQTLPETKTEEYVTDEQVTTIPSTATPDTLKPFETTTEPVIDPKTILPHITKPYSDTTDPEVITEGTAIPRTDLPSEVLPTETTLSKTEYPSITEPHDKEIISSTEKEPHEISKSTDRIPSYDLVTDLPREEHTFRPIIFPTDKPMKPETIPPYKPVTPDKDEVRTFRPILFPTDKPVKPTTRPFTEPHTELVTEKIYTTYEPDKREEEIFTTEDPLELFTHKDDIPVSLNVSTEIPEAIINQTDSVIDETTETSTIADIVEDEIIRTDKPFDQYPQKPDIADSVDPTTILPEVTTDDFDDIIDIQTDFPVDVKMDDPDIFDLQTEKIGLTSETTSTPSKEDSSSSELPITVKTETEKPYPTDTELTTYPQIDKLTTIEDFDEATTKIKSTATDPTTTPETSTFLYTYPVPKSEAPISLDTTVRPMINESGLIFVTDKVAEDKTTSPTTEIDIEKDYKLSSDEPKTFRPELSTDKYGITTIEPYAETSTIDLYEETVTIVEEPIDTSTHSPDILDLMDTSTKLPGTTMLPKQVINETVTITELPDIYINETESFIDVITDISLITEDPLDSSTSKTDVFVSVDTSTELTPNETDIGDGIVTDQDIVNITETDVFDTQTEKSFTPEVELPLTTYSDFTEIPTTSVYDSASISGIPVDAQTEESHISKNETTDVTSTEKIYSYKTEQPVIPIQEVDDSTSMPTDDKTISKTEYPSTSPKTTTETTTFYYTYIVPKSELPVSLESTTDSLIDETETSSKIDSTTIAQTVSTFAPMTEVSTDETGTTVTEQYAETSTIDPYLETVTIVQEPIDISTRKPDILGLPDASTKLPRTTMLPKKVEIETVATTELPEIYINETESTVNETTELSFTTDAPLDSHTSKTDAFVPVHTSTELTELKTNETDIGVGIVTDQDAISTTETVEFDTQTEKSFPPEVGLPKTTYPGLSDIPTTSVYDSTSISDMPVDVQTEESTISRTEIPEIISTEKIFSYKTELPIITTQAFDESTSMPTSKETITKIEYASTSPKTTTETSTFYYTYIIPKSELPVSLESTTDSLISETGTIFTTDSTLAQTISTSDSITANETIPEEEFPTESETDKPTIYQPILFPTEKPILAVPDHSTDISIKSTDEAYKPYTTKPFIDSLFETTTDFDEKTKQRTEESYTLQPTTDSEDISTDFSGTTREVYTTIDLTTDVTIIPKLEEDDTSKTEEPYQQYTPKPYVKESEETSTVSDSLMKVTEIPKEDTTLILTSEDVDETTSQTAQSLDTSTKLIESLMNETKLPLDVEGTTTPTTETDAVKKIRTDEPYDVYTQTPEIKHLEKISTESPEHILNDTVATTTLTDFVDENITRTDEPSEIFTSFPDIEETEKTSAKTTEETAAITGTSTEYLTLETTTMVDLEEIILKTEEPEKSYTPTPDVLDSIQTTVKLPDTYINITDSSTEVTTQKVLVEEQLLMTDKPYDFPSFETSTEIPEQTVEETDKPSDLGIRTTMTSDMDREKTTSSYEPYTQGPDTLEIDKSSTIDDSRTEKPLTLDSDELTTKMPKISIDEAEVSIDMTDVSIRETETTSLPVAETEYITDEKLPTTPSAVTLDIFKPVDSTTEPAIDQETILPHITKPYSDTTDPEVITEGTVIPRTDLPSEVLTTETTLSKTEYPSITEPHDKEIISSTEKEPHEISKSTDRIPSYDLVTDLPREEHTFRPIIFPTDKPMKPETIPPYKPVTPDKDEVRTFRPILFPTDKPIKPTTRPFTEPHTELVTEKIYTTYEPDKREEEIFTTEDPLELFTHKDDIPVSLNVSTELPEAIINQTDSVIDETTETSTIADIDEDEIIRTDKPFDQYPQKPDIADSVDPTTILPEVTTDDFYIIDALTDFPVDVKTDDPDTLDVETEKIGLTKSSLPTTSITTLTSAYEDTTGVTSTSEYVHISTSESPLVKTELPTSSASTEDMLTEKSFTSPISFDYETSTDVPYDPTDLPITPKFPKSDEPLQTERVFTTEDGITTDIKISNQTEYPTTVPTTTDDSSTFHYTYIVPKSERPTGLDTDEKLESTTEISISPDLTIAPDPEILKPLEPVESTTLKIHIEQTTYHDFENETTVRDTEKLLTTEHPSYATSVDEIKKLINDTEVTTLLQTEKEELTTTTYSLDEDTTKLPTENITLSTDLIEHLITDKMDVGVTEEEDASQTVVYDQIQDDKTLFTTERMQTRIITSTHVSDIMEDSTMTDDSKATTRTFETVETETQDLYSTTVSGEVTEKVSTLQPPDYSTELILPTDDKKTTTVKELETRTTKEIVGTSTESIFELQDLTTIDSIDKDTDFTSAESPKTQTTVIPDVSIDIETTEKDVIDSESSTELHIESSTILEEIDSQTLLPEFTDIKVVETTTQYLDTDQDKSITDPEITTYVEVGTTTLSPFKPKNVSTTVKQFTTLSTPKLDDVITDVALDNETLETRQEFDTSTLSQTQPPTTYATDFAISDTTETDIFIHVQPEVDIPIQHEESNRTMPIETQTSKLDPQDATLPDDMEMLTSKEPFLVTTSEPEIETYSYTALTPTLFPTEQPSTTKDHLAPTPKVQDNTTQFHPIIFPSPYQNTTQTPARDHISTTKLPTTFKPDVETSTLPDSPVDTVTQEPHLVYTEPSTSEDTEYADTSTPELLKDDVITDSLNYTDITQTIETTESFLSTTLTQATYSDLMTDFPVYDTTDRTHPKDLFTSKTTLAGDLIDQTTEPHSLDTISTDKTTSVEDVSFRPVTRGYIPPFEIQTASEIPYTIDTLLKEDSVHTVTDSYTEEQNRTTTESYTEKAKSQTDIPLLLQTDKEFIVTTIDSSTYIPEAALPSDMTTIMPDPSLTDSDAEIPPMQTESSLTSIVATEKTGIAEMETEKTTVKVDITAAEFDAKTTPMTTSVDDTETQTITPTESQTLSEEESTLPTDDPHKVEDGTEDVFSSTAIYDEVDDETTLKPDEEYSTKSSIDLMDTTMISTDVEKTTTLDEAEFSATESEVETSTTVKTEEISTTSVPDLSDITTSDGTELDFELTSESLSQFETTSPSDILLESSTDLPMVKDTTSDISEERVTTTDFSKVITTIGVDDDATTETSLKETVTESESYSKTPDAEEVTSLMPPVTDESSTEMEGVGTTKVYDSTETSEPKVEISTIQTEQDTQTPVPEVDMSTVKFEDLQTDLPDIEMTTAKIEEIQTPVPEMEMSTAKTDVQTPEPVIEMSTTEIEESLTVVTEVGMTTTKIEDLQTQEPDVEISTTKTEDLQTSAPGPEMSTTKIEQDTQTPVPEVDMSTTKFEDLQTELPDIEMSTAKTEELQTPVSEIEMSTAIIEDVQTPVPDVEISTTEIEESQTPVPEVGMTTTKIEDLQTSTPEPEMSTTKIEDLQTSAPEPEMSTTKIEDLQTPEPEVEMSTVKSDDDLQTTVPGLEISTAIFDKETTSSDKDLMTTDSSFVPTETQTQESVSEIDETTASKMPDEISTERPLTPTETEAPLVTTTSTSVDSITTETETESIDSLDISTASIMTTSSSIVEEQSTSQTTMFDILATTEPVTGISTESKPDEIESKTTTSFEISPATSTTKPDSSVGLTEGCWWHDNEVYEHGHTVPSVDKCQENCKCINGSVQCERIGCPPVLPSFIRCASTPSNGSCCPTYDCVSEHEQADETCLYEGKTYYHEERVPSGTLCSECWCIKGEVKCALMECSLPSTNCTAIKHRSTDCCPSRYICSEESPQFSVMPTEKPIAMDSIHTITEEPVLIDTSTESKSTPKPTTTLPEDTEASQEAVTDEPTPTSKAPLTPTTSATTPKQTIIEFPEDDTPSETYIPPPSGNETTTWKPSTTTELVVGPGSCLFDGKVYVSAKQIPRDDPCDFCFCFRGDIICLQQTCPPPIPGCYEEAIPGFCCPRYECPVTQSYVNVTTTTPSPFPGFPPSQKTSRIAMCEIEGKHYASGEIVMSASSPCHECKCGGDGFMKCIPKECDSNRKVYKHGYR